MSDLLTIVNHRGGRVPLQHGVHEPPRGKADHGGIAGASSNAGGADVLELSDAAQRADRPTAETYRQSVVDRVRGEISRNEYLSDDKLDFAIERLYRELLG